LSARSDERLCSPQKVGHARESLRCCLNRSPSPVQLLELFLKSSQDKKFVCDTADEALRVMTANLSPAPLLEKLLPFTTHKSQRVRAKAMGAVYGSLVRMVSFDEQAFEGAKVANEDVVLNEFKAGSRFFNSG
jgi:hypothetical protein